MLVQEHLNVDQNQGWQMSSEMLGKRRPNRKYGYFTNNEREVMKKLITLLRQPF